MNLKCLKYLKNHHVHTDVPEVPDEPLVDPEVPDEPDEPLVPDLNLNCTR